MRLLVKAVQTGLVLKRAPPPGPRRAFWGWLNAVFNKVDYERIKTAGPDRAASEWLLRCGAKVQYQGFDRWQHDYNALPTGPLGRYKIQAIDATESCIMYRGFDYLGEPRHLIFQSVSSRVVQSISSRLQGVGWRVRHSRVARPPVLELHDCTTHLYLCSTGLPKLVWETKLEHCSTRPLNRQVEDTVSHSCFRSGAEPVNQCFKPRFEI
uniref:Distal membrane arm assembly component 2 like n=1 Tax=Scleropages formosus TaxID=113540 RepID=A0A8C9RHQ1_SCLFO